MIKWNLLLWAVEESCNNNITVIIKINQLQVKSWALIQYCQQHVYRITCKNPLIYNKLYTLICFKEFFIIKCTTFEQTDLITLLLTFWKKIRFVEDKMKQLSYMPSTQHSESAYQQTGRFVMNATVLVQAITYIVIHLMRATYTAVHN